MSRFWLASIAVLVVAFALRIAYVVHTPGYVPADDDFAYDRLAQGIARSGLYPGIPYQTAYRPPAYPYFLGVVYSFAGPGHARIRAARLVQAGVGTVLVGLLGLLGRRLFGRVEALATMVVAALYVPFVVVGAALFSEPQTAVLEIASVLSALRWRDTARTRWAIVTGVLIGLLTLTRSNAFVVGVAIVIGMGRPISHGLKAVAGTVAAAALVVAPWTVRNAVVMHSFIPVSDEQGGTLAGTYNPVAAKDQASWHLLTQIPSYYRQVQALIAGPEPALQSRLQHLALSYIVDHPVYPLTAAGWNTLRLLELTGFAQARYGAGLVGVGSAAVADACAWSFWFVAVLAAGAIATGSIRRCLPGFFWWAVVLLALTVVFVNGEAPRLRIPIDAFLLVLAGAAAGRLVRAVLERRAGPAA